MTKDEALRLALEALERRGSENYPLERKAIVAIKAALEAKDAPWECVCGANLYIDANGIPRSKASVEPATVMFKPEQEEKDEPVVWGASSISKPEYIAEQKSKTKELRNMMDESVQTIPNFDQLQQIVNNLERCLTRDSKHEFLRVWIRDWTEHKLSKHTSAALEAKDEPWEKFCDSNCVWTDHHPDCKLTKNEPVALVVYRGEICYKSTDDDQSFGIWCPVNYDSKHEFADGTKFYTTLPQQKVKGEPVAWIEHHKGGDNLVWDDPSGERTPLYTTPQQRTWHGLTNEQFLEACKIAEGGNYMVAFQRIQQWLMDSNT